MQGRGWKDGGEKAGLWRGRATASGRERKRTKRPVGVGFGEPMAVGLW